MLSPLPVAGLPRFFVVPGIDMVNKGCHKRWAGARIRPLRQPYHNRSLGDRHGFSSQ